jgi:hypothetical protein
LQQLADLEKAIKDCNKKKNELKIQKTVIGLKAARLYPYREIASLDFLSPTS